MYDKDTYLKIIELTPLVSIDLIVTNGTHVLLGKRNNAPARGSLFVPGGAIKKNETLDVACRRISLSELGVELSLVDSALLGVFDHIYDDNFINDQFGTHYVCIGLNFDGKDLVSFDMKDPSSQHDGYFWMLKEEILDHPMIHENTKRYFRGIDPLSVTVPR